MHFEKSRIEAACGWRKWRPRQLQSNSFLKIVFSHHPYLISFVMRHKNCQTNLSGLFIFVKGKPAVRRGRKAMDPAERGRQAAEVFL